MLGIDEVFHDSRTHDTETKKSEGKIRRFDTFTLQGIRNVVDIDGGRTLVGEIIIRKIILGLPP